MANTIVTHIDNTITNTTSNNSVFIYLITFVIITLIHNIYVLKRKTFIIDIHNPAFIFNVVIVTVMIVYGLKYTKNVKFKKAIKQASIALIIALFAHLDMLFAAFYFILLLSFYYNNNL
jgi:hypothetical protein